MTALCWISMKLQARLFAKTEFLPMCFQRNVFDEILTERLNLCPYLKHDSNIFSINLKQ